MLHILSFRHTKILLFVFSVVFGSGPANATWSIIAVDRDTGEIGIAGASCTFDVSGIASIVPGKGAIVVQAASHYYARMQGVQKMEDDASIPEILQVMKQDQFTPSKQQYGVILLAEGTTPIVDTGSEVKNFKGSKIGNDVAVLGNILVGEQVVNDAFHTFKNAEVSNFSKRLISALQAGAIAGGDRRCGAQKARSAFMSIYSSDADAIISISVSGTDPGGKSAVNLLVERFATLNH
jgi:uncharacterized Ntn-hydrolase superfamily protein